MYSFQDCTGDKPTLDASGFMHHGREVGLRGARRVAETDAAWPGLTETDHGAGGDYRTPLTRRYVFVDDGQRDLQRELCKLWRGPEIHSNHPFRCH